MIDHKTLRKRFIKIQTELDETEKSLEKLVGCGKKEGVLEKFKKSHAVSSSRILFPQKRTLKESSISSELEENNSSEDELSSKKIALRSAVVKKIGSAKDRRDVILRQNCNAKVMSRNCRILGMVQSTLQKFQDEAVKRQFQDLKRIQVEQKVEAAVEEEKLALENQKMDLYSKQKEKQFELEGIKKMMELTESFEIWENNQKHLLNYIITEAEPKICFLPSSHIGSSKKHLKESNKKIQEIMQKEKESMEKELTEICESYQLSTPIAEVAASLSGDDNPNELDEMIQSSPKRQQTLVEEYVNVHLSENECLSD